MRVNCSFMNITSENLWKRLLDNKETFGFRNGFTIPFIVGAYYRRGLLNEDDLQTSRCIRFVLTKILETCEIGKEVAIFSCGLREKYVLQYINDRGQYIKKADNLNINHIIYLDLSLSNNFDDLVNQLWNCYREHITRNEFSYEGLAWRCFNKEEENFIDNKL